MELFNCHIHTFRDVDVPEKFLPLGLVRWLAKRDHKFLFWIARNINPFSDNDAVERYFRFAKTGKLKSQLEIFKNCEKFYPSGSKFIVLPMDMKYMGAGLVSRSYPEQMDEVVELPNNVIKYMHIDPRRPWVDDLFRYYVTKGISGVKLYPSLGYAPYDNRLDMIYQMCDRNKMSVITHGSPANPVHFRGSMNELYQMLDDANLPYNKSMSRKELCSLFTQPQNYKSILEKYKSMNICIAHMGSDYWKEYLEANVKPGNWLTTIIDMIHTYDNFWTDISFTMGNESYWAFFKVLLSSDEKLASRVLFGSDFYMNEVEDEEREWSIKFRAFIGEELFRKIAVDNPKTFLHL